MQPIYLDYAATTPVRPEVREAMAPYHDERFGNPSSLHRWGREARAALEEARARLAAAIGASASEVIFTRGGTEADNMAVLGRAREVPGAAIVCSAVEHKAVLAPAAVAEAEGSPLRLLPVDREGVVDADRLAPLLDPLPAVVSVMWVNNEVGAIQPIGALAERCAAAGAVFHTDAIQALGKVRIRADEVPFGLLSMSAHKIGGPKGVGALFVRRGTKLAPIIHGGGHERGMRAGTEDVAGAVGLARAVELAVAELEAEAARLRSLRDRLETELRATVADLVVNASGAHRSAGICSVSVPGVSREALVIGLDLEGIAVSSGSACSSGAVATSHVLTAMGITGDLTGPAVRFSLGWKTTEREIERVLAVVPPLLERLRVLARAQ